MTGILAILGTTLFVVRVGQMARTWWRKRKYPPERTGRPLPRSAQGPK